MPLDKAAEPKKKVRRIAFAVTAVVLAFIVIGTLIEGLSRFLVGISSSQKAFDRILSAPEARIVLCVGDSHIKGIGAPEGMDFPSQLERRLNAADPEHPSLVLNLGYAGYNTSQSAEKAIGFITTAPRPPKLVIFCAGFNNAWNFAHAAFLPDEIKYESQRTQARYLLSNSVLYRFGVVTLSRLDRIKDMTTLANKNRGMIDVESESELRLIARWIARDIERLKQKTNEADARLVILSYWFRTPWVDPVYERIAAEQNIPYIDVHHPEYYEGTPAGAPVLYGSDWHPNESGYRRIAEIVSKKIEEEKWMK